MKPKRLVNFGDFVGSRSNKPSSGNEQKLLKGFFCLFLRTKHPGSFHYNWKNDVGPILIGSNDPGPFNSFSCIRQKMAC